MATRRPRNKALETEQQLARLLSGNPEVRFEAARDLAQSGDRRALLPLEHVALHDDETFQREGAFVDTTESPCHAALAALHSLYAVLKPVPDDLARVRAHLEDAGLPSGRREALGVTLGHFAVDAAEPLTRHADPAVRLLAHNVIGQTQRAAASRPRVEATRSRNNHALWLEDEEVRLAAAAQDAYRSGLVGDALARFPEEPSPRVRRALCDLWLRYRVRMGGWLKSREIVDLLTDADPAIHESVARHIVDTAARKTTWVDDPARLQETRDRLRLLVQRDGTGESRPAPVVGDALVLVEHAFAPFEK